MFPFAFATTAAGLFLGLIVWLFSLKASKRADVVDDSTDREENSKVQLLDEACLKRGFSKRAVEALTSADGSRPIDAIVIGAGVGGLSCAVTMAKAGKKVLVLEQHDQAGGNTHRFVEKTKDKETGEVHEYEFDTGLHYIGKMRENAKPRAIMDFLTEGKLRWQKMDEVYEVMVNMATKQRFGLPSSVHAFKDQLKKQFPSATDHKSIDDYFALLFKVDMILMRHHMLLFLPSWVKSMIHPLTAWIEGPYHSYASRTTYDVLREITSNEELIGVLTCQWGDFLLPPKQSSFVIHVFVTIHYNAGAYYPVGGSGQVAASLISIIERQHGAVLVRARVDEILFDNTNPKVAKAIGVRVKDNLIYAKNIISAVGALGTYQNLVPEHLRGHEGPFAEIGHVLEKNCVQPSASFLSVFIGLKGSHKELNLPSQNYWLFPSWDHDANFTKSRLGSTHFVSFPSAKDPTWDKRFGNSSVALISTPCDYSDFAAWDDKRVKHRGDDYVQYKRKLQDRVLNTLVEHFPNIRDHIDYVDTGTAVTNNYYLGTTYGESYGIASTPSRWSQHKHLFGAVPPHNKRNGKYSTNLYMCGQDSLGPGVMGVALGGLRTACAVYPSILPTVFSVLA